MRGFNRKHRREQAFETQINFETRRRVSPSLALSLLHSLCSVPTPQDGRKENTKSAQYKRNHSTVKLIDPRFSKTWQLLLVKLLQSRQSLRLLQSLHLYLQNLVQLLMYSLILQCVQLPLASFVSKTHQPLSSLFLAGRDCCYILYYSTKWKNRSSSHDCPRCHNVRFSSQFIFNSNRGRSADQTSQL